MDPKIIICGTGRAGTTLLVRILTSAGMDTGFKPHRFKGVEENLGKAGLEKVVKRHKVDQLPQVVKAPLIVDVLPQLLKENWFEIGLAIIPIRDLAAAAASRKQVHRRAIEAGEDPAMVPGGLWKTDAPDNQHWVLAEQFYRTLEPLVAAEVPVVTMSFPRFAEDVDYFDRTLGPVLETRFGVDRERLRAAHAKECNPALITGEAAVTAEGGS
ncbi:hypothetical protein [Nioella aestuarii]|uniref:hypothetical protein n=1 Tax=Nioella aestuarii TaxID=1662864 RepID=UPI003D7F41E5